MRAVTIFLAGMLVALDLAAGAGRVLGGESAERSPACAPRVFDRELFEQGFRLFRHEWRKAEGFDTLKGINGQERLTNSCSMCHNLPPGSPGYGGNVPTPVGFGRRAPHLFGAGVREMISETIKLSLLARFDVEKRGYLPRSTFDGSPVIVEAADGRFVQFGRLLIREQDGALDLDPSVASWPVDHAGQPVVDSDGMPASYDDARVAGADFIVSPFGATVSDHQFPTIRSFTIGVFRSLFGIPVDDPVTMTRSEQSSSLPRALAGRSAAGARQPALPLDEGGPQILDPSVLDAIEYFLVHMPLPAVPPASHTGPRLLDQFGCTSCHVPSWRLAPQADRRLLGIPSDVSSPAASTGNSGAGDRGPVMLYSDLLHHDLGPRFYEYSVMNGKVIARRMFRTGPLWGVGSMTRYGHDGASPTLDDVIRRHEGEALRAQQAYVEANAADRAAVLDFLSSMRLYSLDDSLARACGWELPVDGVADRQRRDTRR